MPKRCVLFTDIRQSSLLWQKHGAKMKNALKKHNSQVTKLCKLHNGFIIKMIGDAFMIGFRIPEEAIGFAYDMCLLQKEEPVLVDKSDYIKIRMGICCGDISIQKTKIQDKDMIDYFGGPVNMASRMESKVSDVGGFAISIYGEKKVNQVMMNIFKNRPNLKYKLNLYTYKSCEEVKRSMRLLSNVQSNIECFDADILKGVGEVMAYKCNIE
jgi:adenylate cyclase